MIRSACLVALLMSMAPTEAATSFVDESTPRPRVEFRPSGGAAPQTETLPSQAAIPQTFTVEVSGLPSLSVVRLTSEDVSFKLLPITPSSPGKSPYVANGSSPGELRVTMAGSASLPAVQSWVESVLKGSNDRRTVVARLLLQNGIEVRRFEFHDCQPLALIAEPQSSAAAIAEWTLRLDVGRVEWFAGNGAPVTLGWNEVSGGQPISTRQGETYSELSIAGAVVGQRTDLTSWLNGAASGASDLDRDVFVAFIAASGDIVQSQTYSVVPLRYVFPVLDLQSNDLLQERIVLQPFHAVAGDAAAQIPARRIQTPRDPRETSSTSSRAQLPVYRVVLRNSTTIDALSVQPRAKDYLVERMDRRMISIPKRDVLRIEQIDGR